MKFIFLIIAFLTINFKFAFAANTYKSIRCFNKYVEAQSDLTDYYTVTLQTKSAGEEFSYHQLDQDITELTYHICDTVKQSDNSSEIIKLDSSNTSLDALIKYIPLTDGKLTYNNTATKKVLYVAWSYDTLTCENKKPIYIKLFECLNNAKSFYENDLIEGSTKLIGTPLTKVLILFDGTVYKDYKVGNIFDIIKGTTCS